MPRVVRHPAAASFLAAAESWLEQAETEHNLLIGVARSLSAAPPSEAEWLTVEESGETIGAAMRTPPHNPCLSVMSLDAVDALVGDFQERGATLGGIFGPAAIARRFADLWTEATGTRPVIHMRQLVSDCRRVIVPSSPAEGHARPFRKTDATRLSELIAGFHADVGADPPPDDLQAAARKMIEQGLGWGWEFEGELVASVNCGRETRRGATISHIYTPPDLRGRGFAQSLVAHVTAHHLSAGKEFCCLFSDRDKPVPNHVYRKLGYAPVRDFDWWRFEA